MTTDAQIPVVPMDLLRPSLLVACVAFVLGFAAFLAVGWAVSPRPAIAEGWPAPAAASAPAIPADPTDAHVI